MQRLILARAGTYRIRGDLPAVRVHRWQQMDTRQVDQLLYVRVACQVTLTQVIGGVKQQFAAQHLVSVHVGDIFEFGVVCNITV